MKKFAFFIFVLLNISINAQDTLTRNSDRYLFVSQPELCLINNNMLYIHPNSVGWQMFYNRVNISDSTTVYGIAVTMCNVEGHNVRQCTAILFQKSNTGAVILDSTNHFSLQNYFVYEHFYKAESGIIFPLESKVDCTVPIYEFYFDSGITVQDTFYVGIKYDPVDLERTYIITAHAIISSAWDTSAFNNCTTNNTFYNVFTDADLTATVYNKWSTAPWGGIFPIIQPLQDTADSNGVRQVVAASSVRVEPNPTHGSVGIRAAEGLRRVEFFDMTGLRVLSREVTGTETSIDIATLPAGIYVVRVHTTTGTVSRKLVVM